MGDNEIMKAIRFNAYKTEAYGEIIDNLVKEMMEGEHANG
jgi:hypothetical protein